ncbi:hypothetical protein [Agaribacterium sp. ZY112]|uniref:hypothetical protein n=1 Tax=Agaribacterium sp. ZY112 TaxID=3233574 RepID=UPI003525DD5B
MKTTVSSHDTDNVIDLFTGKPFSSLEEARFVRLSPELDGLEMLYSNESSTDKLFSLRILCWALQADGQVVGLVPWLDGVVACQEIQDPLNGQFEGYYDPGIDELFFEAPIHKVVELESAAEYYEYQYNDPAEIVQEIPDFIGTHAVMTNTETRTLTLQEVVSWRLHHDGVILGMIVDENKVQSTPVLPGDESLYACQSHDNFRYFFQYHIANKIKSEDPEALAAISVLVEDESGSALET